MDRKNIIGTTGSNPTFEAPYLKDSITIWDGEYIAAIKNGKQQELSASYSYIPVMQKGKIGDEEYDGIMTNIKANHIALVEQGRAGSDVRVADARPIPLFKGKKMSELNKLGNALLKELAVVFNSGRANDSNGKTLLTIIKNANKAKKTLFAQHISLGLRTHSIANDEDIDKIDETVGKVMDAECDAKDDDDPVKVLEAEDNNQTDVNASDDDRKRILDHLDKMNENDIKALRDHLEKQTSIATGNDEGDEPPKKEPDTASSNTTANDALIQLAKEEIRQELAQAAEAKEIVKPLVGDWGKANDSAEHILRSALKEHGCVPEKGTPLGSLKKMVELIVDGKQRQSMANDSKRKIVKEDDCTRLGLDPANLL